MSRATESKPRLSKEEVELLEAEFQKNHKPSSTTKKALAESMRVDNARINVSECLAMKWRSTLNQLVVLTVGYRTGFKTDGLVRRRRTISGNTRPNSD